FLEGDQVGIARPAEPHVKGRVVLFRPQASQALAAAQADVLQVDAGGFRELLLDDVAPDDAGAAENRDGPLRPHSRSEDQAGEHKPRCRQISPPCQLGQLLQPPCMVRPDLSQNPISRERARRKRLHTGNLPPSPGAPCRVQARSGKGTVFRNPDYPNTFNGCPRYPLVAWTWLAHGAGFAAPQGSARPSTNLGAIKVAKGLAMTDYRLLVTDVDGTLLDRRHQLPEVNVAAIRDLKARGGRFTLATGRIELAVRHFVGALGLDMPMILYNGARIVDPKTGQCLWQTHLPPESVETALAILKELPVDVNLYS